MFLCISVILMIHLGQQVKVIVIEWCVCVLDGTTSNFDVVEIKTNVPRTSRSQKDLRTSWTPDKKFSVSTSLQAFSKLQRMHRHVNR